MTTFHKLAACALSALILGGAPAQTALAADVKAQASKPYTPYSGQAGKDVVWVPTQQALVDRMLDMAGVTADDHVIDLGSGDGRTVITAAKRGARAHGIEYNPDMVTLSRQNAEAEGVKDKATFERADIFQSDFSKASVVTLFLLTDLNIKLRPTLLKMKPGTRVVSNTFDMGDWQPDERIQSGADCTSFCRAYKWVVPAQVGGDWRLGEGSLKLTQTYQVLTGTLTRDGKSMPISDAKMDGTKITFTADGQRYAGEVDGARMTGSLEGGQNWSATRAAS
ncbi:class I SAM-dependent methyltransferase [Aquabacter sp. CN5-332]|uniref:class I SAM-dependent methyltransferase n=1 Tax=Aquabacter sp. CN5-332 TaxID=3156608 RepID=UPI0032B563F2